MRNRRDSQALAQWHVAKVTEQRPVLIPRAFTVCYYRLGRVQNEMSCAESPVPLWGGWWSGLQSALTLCSPAIPLPCFGTVVWLPAEGSGGVNSPKSQLERRGGETWFAEVLREPELSLPSTLPGA